MPEDLNNRLAKLEAEIQDLLSLQSQQCVGSMPCKVITVQGVRSGTHMARGNQDHGRSCIKTQSYTSPLPAFTQVPEHIHRDYTNVEGHTKKKLHEEKEKVEHAHKMIQNLKEELSYSKARMCTMAQDMSLLTDALQSIRTKYKNIKMHRKDALIEIEHLKTCNTNLCRKLQQEMKQHQDQIKQIKEQESIKLEQKVKQEASRIAEQTEQTYQKIQRQNEKLKEDVHNLNNMYSEAQEEIDGLKEMLSNQQKEQNTRVQESEDLKTLLRNERNKNQIISGTIDKLETTVNDLLKVENTSQIEINQLKEEIQKLELYKQNQNDTVKLKNQECAELQVECNRLRNQIKELSENDNNKCRKIEREMEKLKKQMRDKESFIEEEKATLKSLVQELSDVVKRHKSRIKELVHINRQQEGLLENQMIVLRNKEHEAKMVQVALDSSRQKSVSLEEQLEKLKCTLRSYEMTQKREHDKFNDQASKVNIVLQELDKTKKILKEEQDKLHIKEKIIEDQFDTIQKLKSTLHKQSDDLNRHHNEIEKLKKDLDNERYDKEQLQLNIEDITWHKQQLRDQITELEEALKQDQRCSPSCVPDNVPRKRIDQQQKKLLSSLERQVAMKQKEWELRCKLLSTEKKRAVQAAKFATQKLVDTVNDFQAQAETQKQMQVMLTNMVKNKNTEIPRRRNMRDVTCPTTGYPCESPPCPPKKRVSFQN